MPEIGENIRFLIKFGKEKHLKSLMEKGELYFNSPKSFNAIKKTNHEQGDENEGATWIENMKSVQMTCLDTKFGDIVLRPLRGTLSKLTQFNHNFLSCSFYAIRNQDIESSNILNIDNKMCEFGEYALVIFHSEKLINNVRNYAIQENLQFQASKVEYQNLNREGRIEMNAFIKKEDHNYQKEFRMIISNCLEPSRFVNINPVANDGIIIESKYLKNLKFDFRIKNKNG